MLRTRPIPLPDSVASRHDHGLADPSRANLGQHRGGSRRACVGNRARRGWCPASSRRGQPPRGCAAASHRHLTATSLPSDGPSADRAQSDSCVLAVEQGLVECGYGDWTGKSLRELSKEKLWSAIQQQPSAVRFPGGEAMSEMSTRAIAAIRAWNARIDAEHGSDAVWAAVSHGDLIKAILADALGLHLDSFQRIVVDPASISIVRYTAARPYLITANSTMIDLASFLSPPRKKSRTRRPKSSDDAPVGGGLGAADVAQ